MNRNDLKNNENGIIHHCEASGPIISCKHHYGQCAMLEFYGLVVHAQGYNWTLFRDFFLMNWTLAPRVRGLCLSQCLWECLLQNVRSRLSVHEWMNGHSGEPGGLWELLLLSLRILGGNCSRGYGIQVASHPRRLQWRKMLLLWMTLEFIGLGIPNSISIGD